MWVRLKGLKLWQNFDWTGNCSSMLRRRSRQVLGYTSQIHLDLCTSALVDCSAGVFSNFFH